MSREIVEEKQRVLDRVREELASAMARQPDLAAKVSRALAAAEQAKIAEVISPGAATSSQAKAAAAVLAAAVEERDAGDARQDLLERAVKKLEEEIRVLDTEVRRAARAAAVAELNRRLAENAASGEQWVVWSTAALMLTGTSVSDLGLAALQAIDPKQHVSSLTSAIYAKADALRQAVELGGRLP